MNLVTMIKQPTIKLLIVIKQYLIHLLIRNFMFVNTLTDFIISFYTYSIIKESINYRHIRVF